ncbi:MAG: TldD/PmbA family protein [Planctomycetota bacterium]|nr:TldD/PmbA family protein [Planctomycetota bacterium]
MALLEEDHAFEIADVVLAASDADETEVSVECVEERFVRFAHEGPTQAADREKYVVAVRARYGGADGGFREARATTGGLDEASVLGALGRAQTLARVTALDTEAVPLEGAGVGEDAVPGTAPSRPTQDHSTREKVAWVAEALRSAEAAQLEASGLALTRVASRSIVNSAGRRVHGATSSASFEVTCVTPGDDAETVGGAAAARASRSFVDQVDATAVAAEAVQAASLGQAPVEMEPGEIDVVLSPQAVASLLTFAGYVGFGAREVALGQSFMAGRIGEDLLSDQISIVDDPGHPDHRGWLFDGEGTRTHRTPLVEGGRLLGPVTDARWARRMGLKDSGHARPQPSSAGPSAGHLVLEGGDASTAELLERIGDGLFVRQLHYVNVVEPRDLVLTGMTRGGLFRVSGGQVGEPVRNLRFTESLIEALKRVVGVGAEVERCGSLMGGEVVAPALAIKGFKFTSGVER